MFRKKEKRSFHSIGRGPEIAIITFFTLFSLACFVPFLLVVSASFTEERVLLENGYRLFPAQFSLDAYIYIFKVGKQIVRSFGVTVFITITGTILSLIVTSFYAYALTRPRFAFRTFFNYAAFFTMLFSGGLVPTYLVVTRVLGLRDSIWALIIPLLMNAFYIIVMRTFFKTTVPESIIEAAHIDGAGEFRTFLKIVVPISLPSIATIALFTTLAYWNDWFQALLYIDSAEYMPIQYLMMKIESQMQFLIQNASAMGSSSVTISDLPAESLRMAIVVVSTLPIACAYPFFQKYFVKGLTVGSVKG